MKENSLNWSASKVTNFNLWQPITIKETLPYLGEKEIVTPNSTLLHVSPMSTYGTWQNMRKKDIQRKIKGMKENFESIAISPLSLSKRSWDCEFKKILLWRNVRIWTP